MLWFLTKAKLKRLTGMSMVLIQVLNLQQMLRQVRSLFRIHFEIFCKATPAINIFYMIMVQVK